MNPFTSQRLKYVADVRFSNVDKLSEPDEIPVRLCNYTDVYKNERITHDMPFMEATASAAEIRRFGLHVDDVIFTKDSESPTDIAVPAVVASTAPDLVCGYHLAIARPHTARLSGRFLLRALQATGVREQFYMQANGVTRFGLSQAAIGNVRVPVPPLNEQARIADFLDRKTASIDTLIAKQEQLLALLAEKRQALITQAVTKGLDPNVAMKDTGVAWFGQVPKHWEVSRIGYMAVVGNGSTPSREEARFWSEDENGYPWLNSARINDERIVRAERWVTCDALRECHLPKVPPGSVVVAITGEGQTRARAALLEIEATISQHLAYVRPRHGLNAVFLWRQLQAAYQWLRDQSAGGGSTRAALTCEFLRTVSIVVPPLAEQELIVSHIDSELRRIDSLSQRVQAMIERLCEYRQALITAAVTGQLDVTPTIHSERRPSPQAEAV